MSKYFNLITYGCQMNVFDSMRMEDMLRTRLNMQSTDDVSQADVVILNTCSVREKPEQKVYATLNRINAYKRKRPEMVIGVAGCVPRHAGEEIMNRFGFVNFVLGPDHVARVTDIVLQALNGERVIAIEQAKKGQYRFPKINAGLHTGPTAFLTIIKGCNKTCAYCVVPFTRGPEQSKHPQQVVNEVASLVEAGAKEVTLLGQNVNSYGKDLALGVDFVDLLEDVAEINGLQRLRFVTSHPVDASERLLMAFSRIPKLMPYFHLPLQAGSDRVLQAMRRGYTLQDYLRMIRTLRAASPDIVLATDMIVGFPTETREDFQQTLEAVRMIEFDQMFSFKYSPRPHSAAARMKDTIPPQEKAERLNELQALHDEIQARRMQGLLDSVQEVLIEGPSRHARTGGVTQVYGRTPGNWIVNIDGDIKPGTLVKVKITKVMRHSLEGRLQI